MSATIQEPERVQSFTSNKSANTTYSRSSVYQTNGKPLSEEAIYKAKLKYGVYNKPGAPMIGVENSASDSAALLATQTDLSVQPYKRDLSSEAATAALIAKTDSAPKAWKRENFAPDAEYAAISAKSIKFPFNNTISTGSHDESSDAASSVLKRDSSSVAREALEDLYAFDDIRNGTHTFTQFDAQNLKTALESSVATSLTERSNPKLDYRSGITTKSSGMRMNIGDIHKQSSLNATKSMNTRTTPDYNASRSGLMTKKLDYGNGEVNISKITSAANESARQAILNRLENGSRSHRNGILTASDYNSKSLASSGAGLSLQKTGGFTDYAAVERESLKNNTLVDKSVYAIAAANADKALLKIDNETTTKNLFNNREMNIKAIQIAQANLLKRNQNQGKVNLGGGLMMDPLELEQLASSIVKPVLSDIDSKAIAQRKSDFELAKKHEDQKQKRVEYRLEQKRLKLEAAAKREEEKKAKKELLQKDKDLEKAKQQELIDKKTGEVKTKEDELTTKTGEQDKSKEELLSEKLEAEKKIEEEEKLKKDERDSEVKLLQEEKDADVAPILEEYKKETEILDDLISKREAAEKLANEQSERATKAEEELKELNSKLETTVAKIDEIKEELESTKLESEKHISELELLKKESELDIQTKQLKEQEFTTKNEKLLAEKSDLQAKRAAALVSLQEAKKNALLEELKINKALPDHLQKEVDENLSEESDIDEDQFNTTEEEEEEIPKADTAEQEKHTSTPTKTVLDGNAAKAEGKKVEKELTSTSAKAKTQVKKTSAVKKTVDSPAKKSWKSRVKNFLGSPSKPVEKKTTLPISKPKIEEPTKKEVKTEDKNELKQTFSGFSQGSIPEEEKKTSKNGNSTTEDSPNEHDSLLNEDDDSKTKIKEGLFKEDI